jgi:hypothetical protein
MRNPDLLFVGESDEIRRLPMLAKILRRKEPWGLSWRGWLVICLGLVSMFWLFLLRIYPLLSVTPRVDANILVVEGWYMSTPSVRPLKNFAAGPTKRFSLPAARYREVGVTRTITILPRASGRLVEKMGAAFRIYRNRPIACYDPRQDIWVSGGVTELASTT